MKTPTGSLNNTPRQDRTAILDRTVRHISPAEFVQKNSEMVVPLPCFSAHISGVSLKIGQKNLSMVPHPPSYKPSAVFPTTCLRIPSIFRSFFAGPVLQGHYCHPCPYKQDRLKNLLMIVTLRAVRKRQSWPIIKVKTGKVFISFICREKSLENPWAMRVPFYTYCVYCVNL